MLKAVAIAILVALLVLISIGIGILVASSWQPPRHQTNEAVQHEAERDGNNQDEPTKTFGQWVAYLWHRTLTDAVAFFTFWLAIFSCGLLVVAGLQIWLLLRAEHVATRAADAAKEAAEAAQKSAGIANLTLTIGERAFVLATNLPLYWHINEIGEIWWEMTPIWTNAGNTRTEGLHINVNSSFGTEELPADFTFPPHPGPSVDLFLGPKATAVGDPVIKTGDELAAVQRGEKFLYVWGFARYRDVFPGTTEYITRFAWRVLISGDPTKPGEPPNVVRITTKLLPRHNCADNECTRQGFP